MKNTNNTTKLVGTNTQLPGLVIEVEGYSLDTLRLLLGVNYVRVVSKYWKHEPNGTRSPVPPAPIGYYLWEVEEERQNSSSMVVYAIPEGTPEEELPTHWYISRSGNSSGKDLPEGTLSFNGDNWV